MRNLPIEYFESLDDLINVEFKAKRPLLGGTRLRYEVVRKAMGMPMTLKAARLLAEIESHTTIFMTTGAGNPNTLPKGETDGPPGTAVLAKLLRSRGHRIVVLSDEAFMPGIIGSFDALGMMEDDQLQFEAFPLGAEAGYRKTCQLMIRNPNASAGIFIEKPGPNEHGVFHTSAGKPKDPESVAHLHLLAEALTKNGRITIGIGDGGNEIGFGSAGKELANVLPQARECGCPCGGGIQNATKVDSLISASTSNWGAYGAAAALAMLVEDSDEASALPDISTVIPSIDGSVKGGANDGYSGLNVPTVDGTSPESSVYIYGLCVEIMDQARRSHEQ